MPRKSFKFWDFLCASCCRGQPFSCDRGRFVSECVSDTQASSQVLIFLSCVYLMRGLWKRSLESLPALSATLWKPRTFRGREENFLSPCVIDLLFIQGIRFTCSSVRVRCSLLDICRLHSAIVFLTCMHSSGPSRLSCHEPQGSPSLTLWA